MKISSFLGKLHLKWKLIFNILITATLVYVAIISVVIYISKQSNLNFYKDKAEKESAYYASLVSEYMAKKHTTAEDFSALLSYYTNEDNFEQVFKNFSDYILKSNLHIKATWAVLTPQTHLQFDKKQRSISFHNKIFMATKETQNAVSYINNLGVSASATPEILKNFIVAEREYITNPFYISYTGIQDNETFICRISIPLFHKGSFKGIAGIDLEMNSLNEIIKKIKPLEKGYAYVCSSNSTYAAHIDRKLLGEKEIELYADYAENYNLGYVIRTGKLFSFLYRSHNVKQGIEDLDFTSYRTYVPVKIGKTSEYWSVAVVYPIEIIISEINYRNIIYITIGIIGVVIMMLSSLYVSSFITKPMIEINNTLKAVARGDVFSLKKLNSKAQDEIGELKTSVNILGEGLRQIATFAKAIGSGNLSKNFEPLSNKDVIGNSLLDMQTSLLKAKKEVEKRRIEDDKRQWFAQGLALFGDIMRQHNNNLEELTDDILSSLINYLGANQGGIYIYAEEHKEKSLDLIASYAYETKKFINVKILLGEGIVGTCAVEKKTIYLTDIPEGYMEISSGLGSDSPKYLLIAPMLVDNNIFGVIELASFNAMTKDKIEFVEKIAANIATIMTSVKTNHRTNELLELSREQTEQMSMKEEELLQNLEELKATQEEMKLKNDEFVNAQLKLKEEQAQFNMLLSELGTFAFFKDGEGRFTKCSRSYSNFLGVKNAEEMIGKTDFDYLPHSIAYKSWLIEQEIIKTGKPKMDTVEELQYYDGTKALIRSNRMPLIFNNNVVGTMGMFVDITEAESIKSELESLKTILDERTDRFKKEIALLKMGNNKNR